MLVTWYKSGKKMTKLPSVHKKLNDVVLGGYSTPSKDGPAPRLSSFRGHWPKSVASSNAQITRNPLFDLQTVGSRHI